MLVLTVVAVALACKATCLTSNCELEPDGTCSNPDKQCVTKGGSEDCGCKTRNPANEEHNCLCLRKDT
jgi:hypothetical protein